MTVGRPRIFDEDSIERDDATLLGIFDAGVNAGYSAREMGSLINWLRPPATLVQFEPTRVTVAKYRKILAELVSDGPPPRRRRGTARRMAAIAVLAASAGAIAHQIEQPEPVRASTAPAAAVDGPEAPIMHETVNRRRRRRSGARSCEPLGPHGRVIGAPVPIDSTSPRVAGADSMEMAA